MVRPLGRLLTAMVTPFDASGAVDLERAAGLARALVATGSDGVVVNGTTGESPTLTARERVSLLDAVRQAIPEHAVLMGTGSYDTAVAVAHTREAREHGADAALVVSPYYNKPPQEGLVAHFQAVADVGMPVVLYNIPGRCGVNLPPETQLRLAEHPNIVGTKEASGDVDQAAQICAGAPHGFLLWSGDDGLTLPFMSVGAVGVISVASHVAGRALRQLIDAFAAGDVATATRLHHRLLPLFKGLFVTANPIPVKAALALVGVDCGSVRLPLVPLDAGQRGRLAALLDGLGDLVEAPAPGAVSAAAATPIASA
jgi:4-hydroxy-tetrahydrodipicolinate synthase